MANWSDPRMSADRFGAVPGEGAVFDAGLRSYMISVYNTMAGGVLVTGAVAWAVANTPALMQMLFSPLNGKPTILGWLAVFAPLAFVMVLSFGINKLSAAAARTIYWVYAAVMGLSLSTIFIAYTQTSIAATFFATAAAFAGLSLYGYTTKRALSGMGTFLMMGVIGLMVAMVINMFTQSSMMQMVISAIGVLLFAGLTVYDTQKIKSLYAYVSGSEMMGKTVVMGALSLYLDFINMFTFLLQFTGSSRD